MQQLGFVPPWITQRHRDTQTDRQTDREVTWWTVTFSFPFISSAGALELDSLLRRLRN